MDMFVIQGARPLNGTVAVGGAKNSTLPLMAAALAATGETVLRGVPRLADVDTLSLLLETLGMQVDQRSQNELALRVVDERPYVAHYDLVRRMRAGFCVLGPLLAKRGRACVSLPGGCNIGDRPIDLHLKGLAALGAEIAIERGYVVARAERLRGARLCLSGPFGSTVTGTCNVMAAAVLADGCTTIEGAACEPEVVDLGNMLNAMGARIFGLGSPSLHIEGVDRLVGVTHTVIPDRIEAATLMIAAAITRGCVTVINVIPEHLVAILETLREIGVQIVTGERTVEIHADQMLHRADCTALPYPGVPTDVQAQLTALLATAAGVSVVTDTVFPDRFMHAAELVRMGACIRRDGNRVIVNGVERLSGACVMASDLRASAALVLAGLSAAGHTVVRRIYHLDRGYERLESKLNGLGAQIVRKTDEPNNVPEALRAKTETDADVLPLLTGPQWLKRRRLRPSPQFKWRRPG